jgi:hypothetical protein
MEARTRTDGCLTLNLRSIRRGAWRQRGVEGVAAPLAAGKGIGVGAGSFIVIFIVTLLVAD